VAHSLEDEAPQILSSAGQWVETAKKAVEAYLASEDGQQLVRDEVGEAKKLGDLAGTAWTSNLFKPKDKTNSGKSESGAPAASTTESTKKVRTAGGAAGLGLWGGSWSRRCLLTCRTWDCS
jgi:hypothetical protein